jgi:predicted glutamine amidotransferase
MCYLGQPLAMEELIAKPEHSLITQSRDASYHPGCDAKRNIRVNGDGFGLAFYLADKLEKGCCLVKFATPGMTHCHCANQCCTCVHRRIHTACLRPRAYF